MLYELMKQHGTDKAELGYGPHYDKLFEPLQDKPVTLLEIGVDAGYSIQVWKNYFKKARRIIGFDIRDVWLGDGAYMYTGDQGNRQDLEECAAVHGPFDIIIDDGSHSSLHHLIGIEVLLKHVKPGGLFIIEDLCVAPTTIQYLWGYPGAELIETPSSNWPNNAIAIIRRDDAPVCMGVRKQSALARSA